jgi:hypothetical protein
MSNNNFLRIASRVEAAVKAYNELTEPRNDGEWREKFHGEFVSTNLHGI